MRVTSLLLAAAATAVCASHVPISSHAVNNVLSAREIELTESALAVEAEAIDNLGLEKRTLCLNILGLVKIGLNCNGWRRNTWQQYQRQCQSQGYSPRTRVSGSVTLIAWGKSWIPHTAWATYGDYWLPKDVSLWGVTGPAPWVQTSGCNSQQYGYYQSTMSYLDDTPHYYYDSQKEGYWFLFKDNFYFEDDFTVSVQNDNSYWVPQQYSDSWY